MAWFLAPLAGAGIGAAVGGATAAAVGAAAGLGVSQFAGASKAASAAREEARLSNEAIDRQWSYDMDIYDLEKRQLDKNVAYQQETVALQAKNELRSNAYRDAVNARDYLHQVKIRDMQQYGNEQSFLKSDDIYKRQLTANAQSAAAGRTDELRKYSEIQAQATVDQQEMFIKYLENEGKIRARGTTGRSANKVSQAALAKVGVGISILNDSVVNAGRNARAIIDEIGRDESAANLVAFANKMLDPGILPDVPLPFATPITEWQYPADVQEWEYGPEPVRGAMRSPNAAANRVWGTAIPSIASSLVDVGKSKAFVGLFS